MSEDEKAPESAPEPVEPAEEPAPEYGSEDVLEDVEPTPPAPRVKARRSPWNRGRDRVLAAVIAVVVLAVALVIGATSDSAATDHTEAAPPPPLPAAPDKVPGSLAELWSARSGATPVPVVAGDTVATADGGEVAARDPLTGQIRWHYARDLQLCTMNETWGRLNAVYHKDVNCSEVTQLDPGTGRITAQRNGNAEMGTQLVSDGSHVTATGKKLLDTWRDDLVKSAEYGEVPALVNAGKQPRTGCTYGTVAAASGKVGVIERCPGDPADRLTVYKAAPEKDDEPQVSFSSVLAGKRARVVAMSGDLTAVVLPDQKLLVTYNGDGTQRAAYPLDVPPSDLAQDPPAGVEATTQTAANVYWFSGSKVLALSRDDLSPRWTLSSAMGPGITFANQLVIPIKGGLAVLNENDGSTIRTVGVDRRGYSGVVRLGAAGPVLLEERGDTLTALK
ncbi:Rv3212 family protein [Amycolatopsis lexingtonensis]|uniref:Rv3212 family protein n=1 Tax=Amycolatopsis lexingtonensis TaxID=218822 RepID=UPI003F6F11C0